MLIACNRRNTVVVHVNFVDVKVKWPSRLYENHHNINKPVVGTNVIIETLI